jgi:chromosome partitioning protein
VEPKAEGLHVGAILADADPEGWVEELAVPSGWFQELRVVPSAHSLSNREADNSDDLEVRLRVALEGPDADLVVIDCVNRQGGSLTQNALNAADSVVYAATATSECPQGCSPSRLWG